MVEKDIAWFTTWGLTRKLSGEGHIQWGRILALSTGFNTRISQQGLPWLMKSLIPKSFLISVNLTPVILSILILSLHYETIKKTNMAQNNFILSHICFYFTFLLNLMCCNKFCNLFLIFSNNFFSSCSF